MPSKLAIGIDLGTYNSCAAFAEDAQHVRILKNQHGPTMQGQVFPSFVRFDNAGNAVAYGEEARLQMAINPDLVIWGVKRLIGRSYRQIEKEIKRYAYSITETPDGKFFIPVGTSRYSPAEISAFILKWIKTSAETFNPSLVGEIGKAVVTHPAYFDTSQIDQTKEAAKRAGFDEVELIAEPVAAAIAYGLQLDAANPQFIMTIDWGAGTLDIVVIILKLGSRGQPVLVEAKPARGDVALGGIDMDDLLLMRALEIYDLKNFQSLVSTTIRASSSLEDQLRDMLGGDIPPGLKDVFTPAKYPLPAEPPEVDKALWGEYYGLRSWLEQAKIECSRLPATRGYITYQGRTVQVKMARTHQDRLDDGQDWIILEEVLQPMLDVFKRQVEFAIQKSGLGSVDIRHVLLVGGPMHMPCVRKVIQDIFSNNPGVSQELNMIEKTGFPVNPMEAVARGAALFAGHAGPEPTIKRSTFDYGVIFGMQGEILIREGDAVPCEAAFPGELMAKGRPGNAVSPVPIGMYKREVDSNGETYTRMGDYEFPATVNPANQMIRFLPQLREEADKTVSLEIRDMVSGLSMNLNRLSLLDGRKIARPMPFGTDVDSGRETDVEIGGGTSGDKISRALVVNSQEVDAKRRAAIGAINKAESALRQDPNVRHNRELQKELEDKIKALKNALKVISPNGPTDGATYQQLVIRHTELLHLMQIEKIITEEDKKF
jgi:molecular chaperone DnaK (HSP70)